MNQGTWKNNRRIPIACCSYLFSEEDFQAFYELYTRPGFKASVSTFIIGGIARTFLLGLFFAACVAFRANYLLTIVVGVGLAFSIWMIAYGVFLSTDTKRPKWKSERWQKRVQKGLSLMASKETGPITPMVGSVCFRGAISPLLPDLSGGLERALFYNSIPFIDTTSPESVSGEASDIECTVYFYEDGIYFVTGAFGNCFAGSYSELQSAYEWPEQYPNYVLLWKKQDAFKYQRLLIKKSEFIFGDWSDVARRIRASMDNSPSFSERMRRLDERTGTSEVLGYMPESSDEWERLIMQESNGVVVDE